MTSTNQLKLECDLCKWPAKTFDSKDAAIKAGWLTIGQECYYVERSFHDSHVCPSCVEKIAKKLAARPKKKPLTFNKLIPPMG